MHELVLQYDKATEVSWGDIEWFIRWPGVYVHQVVLYLFICISRILQTGKITYNLRWGGGG
jgi:hypothetical protein